MLKPLGMPLLALCNPSSHVCEHLRNMVAGTPRYATRGAPLCTPHYHYGGQDLLIFGDCVSLV